MRAPTRSRRRSLVAATLATVAVAAVAAVAHAADTLVFRGRVEARSTRSHAVYVGLYDNWVIVDGDGDTDLDCWIYDSRGALVDSDTDSSDYCVLETPGVGQHRVTIRNLGRVYNAYELRKSE
jgi:hypothetical protein